MHLNAGGPEVPDVHVDELSEQEIKNLLAYYFSAYSHALQEQMDDAVVEVLMNWFDECYIALLEVSESYRERVLSGLCLFPGPPSNRAKYLGLAMKASES